MEKPDFFYKINKKYLRDDILGGKSSKDKNPFRNQFT
jgi:hypothetical protein